MRKSWILAAFVLIIVGLIGMAASKFDFGNEHKVNFEKSWTFDAQALNNIAVVGDSQNIEVEFVKSNSGTGFVEMKGKADQKIVDKILNSSISNGSYQLDLTTDFEFRFLVFDFARTKIHMTVALPNNDILSTLNMASSSGNSKAYNILAKRAELSTQSGNLTVVGTQAEDLILKAGSGNLKVEGITGNLNASVGSGNIKITDVSGQVSAKTRSGNITITQKTVGNADAETKSGNVTFNVAKGFSGFYDLRTNSGNIKSPESIGTSTDIIKIRTTSGNIRVKQ